MDNEWIEFPRLNRKANTWPDDPEAMVILRFRNGHVTKPAPIKSWRWWRLPKQDRPLPSDPVAWRKA